MSLRPVFSFQAQIGDILALDTAYLVTLFQPTAPWGKLEPHEYVHSDLRTTQDDPLSYSPITGIFSLAHTITRQFPTDFNETTRETIHASVLEQEKINPLLASVIAKHPELVTKLMPLEEELKLNWPRLLSAGKLRNEILDHIHT